MFMQNRQTGIINADGSRDYGKLPAAAMVIGVLSVLFALAIGYVTYKRSYNEAEQKYLGFYLAKAKFLSAQIELHPELSDRASLDLVNRFYATSADKPVDEYVCIVNNRSQLILHTAHPDTVGNLVNKNRLLDRDGNKFCSLGDLVDQKTDFVGDYISSAGQEQIAAFAPISGRGWTLGIHRSKSVLAEEVFSGFRLFVIGFFIACGVLVPISMGVLFYTFRVSHKKRSQAEARIVASLKEKEILLKEIHHRVKNNMQVISSLLNLQLHKISDPDIRDIFLNSRNRIYAMSAVHEKLYQTENLTEIEANAFIHDLLERLRISYPPGDTRVAFDINAQSIVMAVDIAIPVAIILNELISNALKHAFSGREEGTIGIDFSKDDENNYRLVVADNGVGFSGELDFNNSATLGLQLVKALTRQLEGKIEVDKTNGSTVRITFPNTG